MGTALTRGHLDLLFRQVPRLVLCFDGDEAGRRAAWRAMEQALPVIQGMREIRVLFLPEGDDPDSLVRREGLEGWQRRLNAGAVLSETFIRLLAERYPLDTAEGRSQCAHAAVALVNTVTDPLFRGQLCDLVAERTHTPRARIEAMLGQPEAGPQTAVAPPRGADSASGGAAPRGPNQLWSALLARVLQLPQTDWRDPSILRLVAAGGRASEILGSILDKIEASPGISTARLLEQFRDASFFPRLMQLASLPLGGEEPELSRRVALDSADRLFREHCRDRMRSLSSQADRPLEPKEIEELRRLQALLAQGEGMGNRGE